MESQRGQTEAKKLLAEFYIFICNFDRIEIESF